VLPVTLKKPVVTSHYYIGDSLDPDKYGSSVAKILKQMGGILTKILEERGR